MPLATLSASSWASRRSRRSCSMPTLRGEHQLLRFRFELRDSPVQCVRACGLPADGRRGRRNLAHKQPPATGHAMLFGLSAPLGVCPHFKRHALTCYGWRVNARLGCAVMCLARRLQPSRLSRSGLHEIAGQPRGMVNDLVRACVRGGGAPHGTERQPMGRRPGAATSDPSSFAARCPGPSFLPVSVFDASPPPATPLPPSAHRGSPCFPSRHGTYRFGVMPSAGGESLFPFERTVLAGVHHASACVNIFAPFLSSSPRGGSSGNGRTASPRSARPPGRCSPSPRRALALRVGRSRRRAPFAPCSGRRGRPREAGLTATPLGPNPAFAPDLGAEAVTATPLVALDLPCSAWPSCSGHAGDRDHAAAAQRGQRQFAVGAPGPDNYGTRVAFAPR